MALFNFDSKDKPLASRKTFAGRLLGNITVALALVAVALGIGMWGYQATEGMGPVDPPLHTEAGKIFAGIYALACGLILVLVSGIVLAPVFHRVLHALHVDDDDRG